MIDKILLNFETLLIVCAKPFPAIKNKYIPVKIKRINRPSGTTWLIEKNLMYPVPIELSSINCQIPPIRVGIKMMIPRFSLMNLSCLNKYNYF